MYRGNLIKHNYEHHSLTLVVRKSSQPTAINIAAVTATTSIVTTDNT
jgi:hypothetical protein